MVAEVTTGDDAHDENGVNCDRFETIGDGMFDIMGLAERDVDGGINVETPTPLGRGACDEIGTNDGGRLVVIKLLKLGDTKV